PENLSKAVNIVVEQLNSRTTPQLARVEDYQSLNVSTKVVRLITSYTGYVNRVVWRDYSTKA
ncbi:MAG: UDP-N-acetylglucosamine 2-epimerase (non-hydrolyzing), partial [Pseudomonadota bacterium]|nr:UDP-N-acetylglucosamine 2-epimerase (non-hydrolyzing) [Pseudomonadota bacterium]